MKIIYSNCLIAITIFFCTSFTDDTRIINNASVILKIDLNLDERTCDFKITNNSDIDIHTTGFSQKFNHILVLDANENHHPFYDSGNSPVIIKSGESKNFEFNYLCSIIEREKLRGRTDISKFKFYWIVYNTLEKFDQSSPNYKFRYNHYKSEIIEVDL